MQRKLEIIRSLIHTPDVLFLDEPTQGLDAVSRHGLWEYINETRSRYGTTVFLTTHYIDEAENVDTVCLINNGKIASCCPPAELKRSLLRHELILDADDRTALTKELSALGLQFSLNGRVVVPYRESAENAYIEFLTKQKEDKA